jgi:hypothetical protein
MEISTQPYTSADDDDELIKVVAAAARECGVAFSSTV